MANCKCCGTVVVGRYCHECGQRQRPLLPPFRSWLAEVLDEVFFVEARLPRTLKLLILRPGFLAREWGAGRRAAYVSPVRLYLAAAAVFFIVWPLTTESQSQFFADLAEGFLAGARAAGDAGNAEEARIWAEALGVRVVSWLQPLLLVAAVPFLAVLNLGEWAENAGSFVYQITVSLLFHTVGFALVVVWSLIDRVWGDVLNPNLSLLILFAYLALVIRGAFATTWRMALVRGVAVGLVYAFVSVGLATALAGLSTLVWPLRGVG